MPGRISHGGLLGGPLTAMRARPSRCWRSKARAALSGLAQADVLVEVPAEPAASRCLE